MKLDEELWANHQYGVLANFVHHLAYWRCSFGIYRDLGQESEFWVHTIDAHLLRAVIDWCMVFGTDSNRVHWKRVVLDDEARRGFRSYLLRHLSLTEDAWNKYWANMTTFRNDFVAHRVTSSPYPAPPMMEQALEAVVAYDLWIRDALREDRVTIFDEPPLSMRYDRLMRTSAEPLRKMIGLGPAVDEEYEGRPPRRTPRVE